MNILTLYVYITPGSSFFFTNDTEGKQYNPASKGKHVITLNLRCNKLSSLNTNIYNIYGMFSVKLM